MAETEPTVVVLVHGAGGGGWMWEPVTAVLERSGVDHVAVDLPTVGAADPGLDVHADVAHLRAVLDGIDRPVLLCGNSYGGAVITGASAGRRDVVRLVYLAAFMPDVDDELLPFMAAHSSPEFLSATVVGDDGLVAFDPAVVRELAFGQADPGTGERAVRRLRPMAFGAGGPPTLGDVGWRTVASTYVVCAEDRSILPEAQRSWARTRATDRVEVPYDHCPQMSHPVEVAELLVGLAATAAGGDGARTRA